MLKRTGCVIIDKNQSAFWAENSRILAIVGEVAPDQRPREGPAGGLEKKEIKKNTFKAGMYVKTNRIMTKCPEKFRHLRLSFGHFRQSDVNFAGKSGSATTICKFEWFDATNDILFSALHSGCDNVGERFTDGSYCRRTCDQTL